MAQQLDVYREWLGIADTERPLSYYQLLRLKKFEDDPVRVRTNYRKMNAHVRKYAAGDYAAQSQELLNGLAKSMLCLTDATRKAECDASIGREDQEGPRRRSLEEILLLRKVVDRDQLDKARSYADTVGLEVRDALVQQKVAKPEVIMQVYAESLGLPYLDPTDMPLSDDLVRAVPAVLARQHSCVPVMMDDNQLLMATPIPLKPEVEEELRLRTGVPVRTVLCTVASANEIINRHYSREAAAAEMAAGGAAPGKTDSTAGAAKPAAKKPAASTDEKRRQWMIPLMTFNFIFMGVMLWQTVLKTWFIRTAASGFFDSLLLAVAVAAPIGAIVYLYFRFARS